MFALRKAVGIDNHRYAKPIRTTVSGHDFLLLLQLTGYPLFWLYLNCIKVMLTQKTFRQLALSFPDSAELPHFDKASFRYMNKIFATLWEKENRAMIKLPLVDQSVFCDYDPLAFFPVPGGWGKQGATFVELKIAKRQVVKEALTVAYNNIRAKK